jgi:Reverse transcriptase (RNA-dependent DNA polymerase)
MLISIDIIFYGTQIRVTLKKAFDVCSHDILIKKLAKFGITDNALRWFQSYLKNRQQKVDINGKLSNESIINISVLQGTILGPILFLCYINDIFYATSLSMYLFADDSTGLAEHKNLTDLCNFINIELKKLANWFTCNKMAVNISKTKYIIFRTKGKKIENPPPNSF